MTTTEAILLASAFPLGIGWWAIGNRSVRIWGLIAVGLYVALLVASTWSAE